MMRRRKKVMNETRVSLPRTPDGRINNCALANGDDEKACQMCGGACPDRHKTQPAGTVSYDPADNPLDWGNANKARERPFDRELEKIVETVVRVEDPHRVWEQLEAGLRLGEKRTQPGEIARALDLAETNARKAHALWMMAILEEKRWQLNNAVIFGAIRIEAMRIIEREKREGQRSKPPTDKDVDAMIAVTHPDEYHDQEMKKARIEAFVKSMENLTKCCMERIHTLQTMRGKER